jgi:hypothetical protein
MGCVGAGDEDLRVGCWLLVGLLLCGMLRDDVIDRLSILMRLMLIASKGELTNTVRNVTGTHKLLS